MVKIKVGTCRKMATIGRDGRPDYGSLGATAEIEFELDDTVAMQISEVRKAAKRWYEAATGLVEEQLDDARKSLQTARELAAEAEAAAEPERQPEPDRRPMSQAEADRYDDRYDDRDRPRRDDPPPPARRDDRPRERDDRRDDRGSNRGGGGGGRGRNDGPPRGAKQLGGWARSNGCMQWFADLGQDQGWGKFVADWTDDDAMWAYRKYQDEQRSTPSARRGGDSNGRRY